MRFAQLLSSHLTPEWRSSYIDYEALKRIIYQMVSLDWTKMERDNDDADPLVQMVDEDIQSQFFSEIQRQLDNVNSFYKAREAELNHQLRQLTEETEILSQLMQNIRTRNTRSTSRKRSSLIKAFCEFYYHLSLLQNFQKLNYTGFRKILKKHDKLAKSERGGNYFKEFVGKSYFNTSKLIDKLIKDTENVMINQLEKGNRGRAMSKLRVPPLEATTSHWSTLVAGWLMGAIFICIIVAIVTLIYRLNYHQSWSPDTGVLVGLRSGFILALWFFGFAVNTVGWRRSGVNNVLIFEFDPRNYLHFQELFAVAGLVGLIWCIGLLLFLFADWIHIPHYVGPLTTWAIIIVLFIIPIPFFRWRSRLWLFKVLIRVLCAPFFDVTFADFWIADQLNSLAIVLLDMEYFICYLVYGQNASPDSLIQCGSIYYGLRPIVAMLPGWWRFAQCIRRYRDTREAFPHLVNAGKYSTAFFVVIFSTIATALKDKEADTQSGLYYTFFVIWLLSAIISSCYTFSWDIKMDWGFFEKGYIIRKETIYDHKVYYILAIIEDLLLRWVWTLTISVGEGGSKLLNDNIFRTVLGSLEIFRRFIWNFFRLENEHLNNCGQFRAVRDISVHPIDIGDIAEENNDTNGPLRIIRRKASVILGLDDQRGGGEGGGEGEGERSKGNVRRRSTVAHLFETLREGESTTGNNKPSTIREQTSTNTVVIPLEDHTVYHPHTPSATVDVEVHVL